jgi:peptidoglycan/LPS O-acetylase OafA/YrhL
VIALNISNPAITPYRFAASRVARIVPTYWFLTVLATLIILLLPSLFSSGTSVGHVVGSLLFSNQLFGHVAPVISLGWTLNLEMIFYTIVAFVLVSTFLFSLPGQVYILSTLGLVIAVTFGGADAILFEFIFGFLCYWIWRMVGLRPGLGLAALALGIIGLGLWLVGSSSELPRWLNFGVPAMFLVLGALLLPQARFPHLKKLGFSSYSIYLTQWFSIPACVALVVAVSPADHVAPAVFALALGVCTLLGILYSLLIDEKLHSWARKALRV